MKWPLVYLYTWNKRKQIKPTFNFNHKSTDLAEVGISSLPESWKRENLRELPPDKHAADTIGFSGVHQDGSALIIRLTRRPNRISDVLLYLRLPNNEEYQLPSHPDTSIANVDCSSFTAGGLTMELLEPLRRWRIFFNGYLRKVRSSDGSNVNEISLVEFNFTWHPIYCFMVFPEDFSTKSMAELLSKRSWGDAFKSPWSLFTEEWHEQVGELHGIVNVENMPEIEMFVRGIKLRRHGLNFIGNIKNKIYIQGYLQNGTAFHIFVENIENGPENFVYGYVCPPCMMVIEHLKKYSFDMKTLYNIQQEEPNCTLNFQAGERKYELKISPNGSGFVTYCGPHSESSIKPIHILLNGKSGNGIIETIYRSDSPHPQVKFTSMELLEEPVYKEESRQFVVSFMDDECKSSKIVGGKAASLGLMKTLMCRTKEISFSIPNGLCVTNTAFMNHLKEHPHLLDAIQCLEDVVWKKNTGSLADECERMVSLMTAAELSQKLKTILKDKLINEFGQEFETIRFAVRSSAIGEDGLEMSAAGQNETFLGIKQFDQICLAIQKCWASQFAYRSIEYKRQNGQLLNAGMGVVIQEMIAADVSGVLFTQNPLTGSRTRLVITANFGLGESIVSATVDPDTVTLQRTWDDNLIIENRNIGKKEIMITMHDEFGTVEREVNTEKILECTISDKLALKLGEIGIYLENCFGNARDIEWAVKDENIYILQSRPVVTDGMITDFEIIHEFDTAMRTDTEQYSTANVGEVMPGAQCPLTLGVLRAQMPFIQSQTTWRLKNHRYDPTITEMFANFYGHVMSERLQLKAWTLSEEKTSATKATEVALYGRVLDDDKATQIALERYAIKPPGSTKLGLGILVLKGMFFGKSNLTKTKKNFQDYPNPIIGCQNLWEGFEDIGNHLHDIVDVMYTHALVSMASSMWNLATLNILSQGTGEYSMDQYADFAMLIGSCNAVESGNVPFSLQELANEIAKEITPNEFREMQPEIAYIWLKENKNEAGKRFSEFLKRHGHRGLKEFDLSCTSWATDPTELVKVLQNMMKNSGTPETQKAKTNVIDRINTPLSSFKKRMLSFVLKRCTTGVCYREESKSLLIKVYEGLRLGYRTLAQLMVNEGLIPDANLIFFFTHEEIEQLIKTRSAKILRRVKHRARLYPFMDRLLFKEMIEGYPKPIEDSEIVFHADGTELTGYPVSRGIIQAPARVVHTFLEVNTIQPGEILITVGTDIGWSPYFPILSGVVTELGGLISHGAVVAREFGLPCIVGVENATRVFQSGDMVLLNATKGTITKVG